MRVIASLLGAAALLAVLSGCQERRCPACAPPGVNKLPPPANIVFPGCGDALTGLSVLLRERIEQQRSVNMLLLSGGGSRGAFGAGVLNGWSAETNGTQQRPSFDLVTGVSTGAIQATLAYLGQSEDETLKTMYTTMDNKEVVQEQWFWWFRTARYNLDPLREYLATKILPPAVIDQVAQEYERSGRQLWIATTNLDTTEFCPWNLGEVAKARDYKRYIELIIASSANPTLFAPVIIDGAMHVDGGVRSQLFVNSVAQFAREWRKLLVEGADSPSFNVYALVNDSLSIPRSCTQPNLLAIAERAVTVLTSSGLRADIASVYARLQQDLGAQGWQLNVGWIPADYPAPNPGEFVPAQMQELYRFGVNWTQSEAAWCQGLPGLDSLNRACYAPTRSPIESCGT